MLQAIPRNGLCRPLRGKEFTFVNIVRLSKTTLAYDSFLIFLTASHVSYYQYLCLFFFHRDLALFLYSGGYSPGMFALSLAQKLPSALVDVGDLEIIISREQPRIEAKVDVKLLGGQKSTVSVKANLEVESGIRFSESYVSASVLDRSFNIPEQLRYSRELFVTYVDEDILLVRDASGVPEVLVRKEKVFTSNWGTEPGEVQDMKAQGEN